MLLSTFHGFQYIFPLFSLHPSTPKYPSSLLVALEPPSSPFFKLNFNGSVRNSSAEAGFIIRDFDTNLVKVAALNLGASSVSVAEATTLQHGIWLAIRNVITHLHIEELHGY